jgi:hypothetical protein
MYLDSNEKASDAHSIQIIIEGRESKLIYTATFAEATLRFTLSLN